MGDYILQDGELYHYGVLGMKWGVRKKDQHKEQTKKKKNQTKRDLDNLAKVSKRYYSNVNTYNKTIDSGKSITNNQLRDLNRSREDVQKMIDRMMKKYSSVTVDRGFKPDGYTIEWVEARIAQLDTMGRISNIEFIRTPMND